MATISGNDIVSFSTINSWYANGCVDVYTADKHYLMKVSEILKFHTEFNRLTFNVNQKRKHGYLEVIEPGN
jgi:hypothetical protein